MMIMMRTNRGRSEKPEPAVDTESGDHEIGDITSGEDSDTSSDNGCHHEPVADVLPCVVVVEVGDAVVGPGISSWKMIIFVFISTNNFDFEQLGDLHSQNRTMNLLHMLLVLFETTPHLYCLSQILLHLCIVCFPSLVFSLWICIVR